MAEDKQQLGRWKIGFFEIAILAGLVCTAASLGYKYVTADPAGYCRAQQRYIPDEEFIQTSLALYMELDRQHKMVWDADPKLYERHLESYARSERNRQRDGFAKMDRSDTHTIWRWLFGYQQIQVILNANSGDEWVPFYYDVCGDFIDSRMGHSYPGNIRLNTTNYLEILSK